MVNVMDTMRIFSTLASGVEGALASDLLLSWTETEHNLDLTDPNVVATQVGDRNLVVRPGVLQPGLRYTFVLTAENPAKPSPASIGGFGMGSLTVEVNTPPSLGTCAISPSTGEALTTTFKVACSGWSDPQHEPLKFSFKYEDSDRVDGATKLLRDATTFPSYSAYLPTGLLSVLVSIIDTKGASTLVAMSVNVTSPAAMTEDPVQVRCVLVGWVG
jgi:hypothetical protein